MVSEKHFMIDYIHENPVVLRRTLEENEGAIQALVERVRENGIERIVVTGVGSSYTANLIAAPLFRNHCSLEAHILTSIESRYYTDRLVDDHTLFVAVSRSGEREWVVDTLRDAIKRGAIGVAVTGTPDSLMAQSAQIKLITAEGPEVTFPKTKSVICCAGLMMRLALALALPEDREANQRLSLLRSSPELIELTIEGIEGDIHALIPSILEFEPIFVGGTGSNYGAAMEAAIKLQETTYTISHGDHTGEFLHGSLGPFARKWMMILLVNYFDLELSKQLFDLIGKFGALRIGIVEPGIELGSLADHVLTISESVDPMMAGLVYLPPLQLITYYLAVAKGMNPDAPPGMRNVLDAILPEGREEPELRS